MSENKITRRKFMELLAEVGLAAWLAPKFLITPAYAAEADELLKEMVREDLIVDGVLTSVLGTSAIEVSPRNFKYLTAASQRKDSIKLWLPSEMDDLARELAQYKGRKVRAILSPDRAFVVVIVIVGVKLPPIICYIPAPDVFLDNIRVRPGMYGDIKLQDQLLDSFVREGLLDKGVAEFVRRAR